MRPHLPRGSLATWAHRRRLAWMARPLCPAFAGGRQNWLQEIYHTALGNGSESRGLRDATSQLSSCPAVQPVCPPVQLAFPTRQRDTHRASPQLARQLES